MFSFGVSLNDQVRGLLTNQHAVKNYTFILAKRPSNDLTLDRPMLTSLSLAECRPLLNHLPSLAVLEPSVTFDTSGVSKEI